MQVQDDAVRCGIHSGQQYRSFEDCLRLWERAEELGYDWISLFDHLRPRLGGQDGPCFEGTTLLSALAARTKRIRCAMLVSAVTWRHPAIVAAAAATIDHVSGGRLEFGFGAAAEDFAYGEYGIPFPPLTTRLEMLNEACRIVRCLWTGKSTSFSGKHFHLSDAHLEPKPLQQRLPLIIGGGGEHRTLRLVAEHADIWNTLAADVDAYSRKCDALTELCRVAGRPSRDVRRSITFRAVLAEDRSQVPSRTAERMRLVPEGSSDRAEYLVFGTAEQCVEALMPYVRLGVKDFLLAVRPPLDWPTIELFASKVAPALRATG
jgi:alkanesulfonate monooxygenase SsuD/methylene tetrahydromethanopterin reductase-like flavin-dependent oxidoreductase (luciferase family)